MPTFIRGHVRIAYTRRGDPDGESVLLIAPGGMRSAEAFWGRLEWDPRFVLADAGYDVISMDQRNAGNSFAPVSGDDGWDTYTGDQLGLLDHLGVDTFHAMGMCIGGPYVMGLIRHAPGRVRSAVLFQPIGLDDNRSLFFDLFDAWRGEITSTHSEATEADWESFKTNMFGGDFLFNASREDAQATETPVLLLMGDDQYHPQTVSRELAELLPNATFVEQWKEPEHLKDTDRRVKEFLAAH